MSFIIYSTNKYHVRSPGLLVSPLLIKPLGLCAAGFNFGGDSVHHKRFQVSAFSAREGTIILGL